MARSSQPIKPVVRSRPRTDASKTFTGFQVDGRAAIAGIGNRTNPEVAIVLDYPSSYNWMKQRHLWGEERMILAGLFESCGRDLSDMYITYAIPYLIPPKKQSDGKMKQTPLVHDFNVNRERLFHELRAVNPKKLLILGGTANGILHGATKPIGVGMVRGRGEMFDLWADGEEDGFIYSLVSVPPYYVTGDENDQFRDLAYDINKLFRCEVPEPEPDFNLVVVETYEQLVEECEWLSRQGRLSVDYETTGFNPRTDTVDALGIGAWGEDGKVRAVVIPRGVFYEGHGVIKNLLNRPDGPLQIYHNSKFDLKFMQWHLNADIWEWNVRDTILMNYLLDERPIRHDSELSRSAFGVSPHGLKTISRVRYDAKNYKFDFKTFQETPEDQRDYGPLYFYLGLDLYYTLRLHDDLSLEIEEESPKLWDLLERLCEGTKAFVQIEMHGMVLDVDHLQNLATKYQAQLDKLYRSIQSIFLELGISDEYPESKEFNPNSPKQVEECVYGWLEQKKVAKIDKASDAGTDKDTLRIVINRDGCPRVVKRFVGLLLKYREVSKALGTYVNGLLSGCEDDGRIRADFHVNGTATGRMSCSNPNLQNIPVLQGPEIRKAFIAPPGYTFLTADYSQLELRVAAFLSQDEKMIGAYRADRDIHREVAAAMFKIPVEQVTYEQRYAAKFVDFGVLYGRSADSLANGRELVEYHWSLQEAQEFINNFLGEFYNLGQWMAKQKRDVLVNQYTETFEGRRRRFPLILPSTAGSIQRQAINTPVQGQASDFAFAALIRLHPKVKALGGHLILTVHDSIAAYVKDTPEDIEAMKQVFQEEMVENLPDWVNVPIKIDFEVARSWGEGKD